MVVQIQFLNWCVQVRALMYVHLWLIIYYLTNKVMRWFSPQNCIKTFLQLQSGSRLLGRHCALFSRIVNLTSDSVWGHCWWMVGHSHSRWLIICSCESKKGIATHTSLTTRFIPSISFRACHAPFNILIHPVILHPKKKKTHNIPQLMHSCLTSSGNDWFRQFQSIKNFSGWPLTSPCRRLQGIFVPAVWSTVGV